MTEQKVATIKIWVSKTKFFLFREPEISDQRTIARSAGGQGKLNNLEMGVVLQDEMMKQLFYATGFVSEDNNERINLPDLPLNLEKVFSLKEYTRCHIQLQEALEDDDEGLPQTTMNLSS